MSPGLTIFERRILVLLAGAVCLYSTKLFLSPIYVIYPIVLPIAAIVFFGWRRQVLTSDSLILMFLALLVVIHGVISWFDLVENPVNGTNVNIIFGIVLYLIVRFHGKCFSVGDIKRISQAMIWVSVTVVLFSAVYRHLYPTELALDDIDQELYARIGLYGYKVSDPLFGDSNATGMLSLIMLSYILFLRVKLVELPYIFWATAGLIIGLIATYSRATMIAGAMVAILYLYNRFRGALVFSTLLLICFVVGIAFSLTLLMDYVVDDYSVIQKIDTLLLIGDLFFETSHLTEILFGYGPGQSMEILGTFPHNVFGNYLTETGVLGLLLFLAFLFSVRHAWLITLPCMVAALSFFMYLGVPFFFLPIVLAITLNQALKAELLN